MRHIAIIVAAALGLLASGCTGIRYVTQDLKGKRDVGAVTDAGSPLSAEAGKIATVYVSAKDGDKLPEGLADIIRAARGDLSIGPTGIQEGAGDGR